MPKKSDFSVTLSPSFLALPPKRAGELNLLIRLFAPGVKPTPRQPLNLALALDCSGSMSGAPLSASIQAAISLIGRLRDDDRVAVVAYADNATVVVPSTLLAGRRTDVISVLQNLRASGMTALHAGWLAAAAELAPHVGQGVSRVLLLSDGQANIGETNPDVLAAQTAKMADAGVGTSTYGVGLGFNEQLMTALAVSGRGQAFYAETANALSNYFNSELSMLDDTIASNVEATVTAHQNGVILPVSAFSTVAPKNTHPLPDVLAGQDSWAVLRAVFTAESAAVEFDVSVSWTNQRGVRETKTVNLVVPRGVRAKANPDQILRERLRELDAARLQKEALAAAHQGRWEDAQAASVSLSASAANNAYVSGLAANLNALIANRDVGRMSKEVAYASHTIMTRSVQTGEDVSSLSDRYGQKKAQQGAPAQNQNAPPRP